MSKIKASLIIFAGIMVVTTIIFIQNHLFKLSLRNPINKSDTVEELVTSLEQVNLSPSSTPFILGDTINASISGFAVKFSLTKDLKTQVRTLQLVLPRLKMNSKGLTEVDLRFTKVILRP